MGMKRERLSEGSISTIILSFRTLFFPDNGGVRGGREESKYIYFTFTDSSRLLRMTEQKGSKKYTD